LFQLDDLVFREKGNREERGQVFLRTAHASMRKP
jgi:hypothetical protein